MRPVGSKYLLEEPLGRGATGTVWRARQRETAGAEAAVAGQPGETVAIKVLKEELASDADIVMRFLRERSVLLRLTHPNIVRVRDLVVEGELLALVMDLIDGPDLHRYLRENGPLTPVAAALLTAQIADALAASHADGVVHRDLKPANVLLKQTGGEMHPMLTDFGIARLADSPGLTRTHEFVGTPAYVAPESAEGRPQTSAVDVYGAGILLYELVTGRPVRRGLRPGGAAPAPERRTAPPLHRPRPAVDGHRALPAQEPRRPSQRREPRPRPARRRRGHRCAREQRADRRRRERGRAPRPRPGARAGPGRPRRRLRPERRDQRPAAHLGPGGRRRPHRRTPEHRGPRPDRRHAAGAAGTARRPRTGRTRGPAPLAEPAARGPRPQRTDAGPVPRPEPGPAAPPPPAAGLPPAAAAAPGPAGPAAPAARLRLSAAATAAAVRHPQPQQPQRYAPPPAPEPQQPRREPRPPRQRSANPMRIPGLGCLKGAWSPSSSCSWPAGSSGS